MPHKETHTNEMKECIDLCRECSTTCLETINHCLELGSDHVERKHIVLLQVCADICETSARAMALGSAHHREICTACAVICDACAEDCASFQDDSDMRECVDVCRRCADSCREMANQAQSRDQKERRTPSPGQSASV